MRCTIKQFKHFSDLYSKKSKCMFDNEGVPILVNHMEVVRCLIDGEKSFTDLQNSLKMSKSTLSNIVNKYIDEGLFIKRECEADKRHYYVSLSEDGLNTFRKIGLSSQKFEQAVFTDFTDIEKEQFIMYLDRIINNMENIK